MGGPYPQAQHQPQHQQRDVDEQGAHRTSPIGTRMEDMQLSRPASFGPFGKVEAECKTHVDEETLALFDKKAATVGGRSKLLRNLVYLVAHGKSYDVLIAEAADRRMRLALGEGLELGQAIQALHVRGEVDMDQRRAA